MAFLTAILLGVYEDTIISIYEIFFWIWVLTRTMGELREMDSYDFGGLWAYGRDVWNQLDVLTFAFVCIIIGCRVLVVSRDGEDIEESSGRILAGVLKQGGSMSDDVTNFSPTPDPGNRGFEAKDPLVATTRNLYAILVLLVYVRVIQYLRIFKGIGVLSVVIGSISYDVLTFGAIQLTLTTAFGVAFATLQPDAMAVYEPYEILGNAPIFRSFWALFGEYDIERLIRQINDEKPTIVILPLLMWLYLFAATIILVNLLIAQMSDTYSSVTAQSLEYWQFERCRLVSEFQDSKPVLPPPLNVIAEAITFIRNLFKREQDLGGFKTLPPAPQLVQYVKSEGEALQRCITYRAQRSSRKVDARIEKTIGKIRALEEANRARFVR